MWSLRVVSLLRSSLTSESGKGIDSETGAPLRSRLCTRASSCGASRWTWDLSRLGDFYRPRWITCEYRQTQLLDQRLSRMGSHETAPGAHAAGLEDDELTRQVVAGQGREDGDKLLVDSAH